MSPSKPAAITASIVIPAFNRLAPLRETLASAEAACRALLEPAEIILVDDGSEPPLAEALPEIAALPVVRIIRQPNQGSIVGRLTGLAAARGEFVLFLDSDDLVAPSKLLLHCAALRTSGALASYDDTGELSLIQKPPGKVDVRQRLERTDRLTDLVLRIQPPPHGCVYRRDYLVRALRDPIVPPTRSLDSVGDVWLFYNISVHNGRVVKIDEALSLIGRHDEGRYSNNWEKLGVAALRTAERFMRDCPRDASTQEARQLVGEAAFNSWRRLPKNFSPDFERRMLAVWKAAPRGELARLGGPLFRALAGIFGPVGAARILRLRNAPYERIQTVPPDELKRILQQP